MNPIIVIATHKRYEITNELLRRLIRDQKNTKIVLVTSDIVECKRFEQLKLENVIISNYPNNPLGLKWQHGVNVALDLGADPVIILGSDDDLNPNFVKNAIIKMHEGYDFIGFRRYYVKRAKKRYLIDYKPEMPIGGGRVYSRKLLEYIGNKIFAPVERKLDDYGWNMVVKSGMKKLIITDIIGHDMYVTAIKGSWPMMNPFNQYHPNFTILCVE